MSSYLIPLPDLGKSYAAHNRIDQEEIAHAIFDVFLEYTANPVTDLTQLSSYLNAYHNQWITPEIWGHLSQLTPQDITPIPDEIMTFCRGILEHRRSYEVCFVGDAFMAITLEDE